jgi:hypothetical protein
MASISAPPDDHVGHWDAAMVVLGCSETMNAVGWPLIFGERRWVFREVESILMRLANNFHPPIVGSLAILPGSFAGI